MHWQTLLASNQAQMLATSFGSFLIVLGIVWFITQLLKWGRPIWLWAFDLVGIIDRYGLVIALSFFTGTRRTPVLRWTQFLLVNLLVVLLTAFAPEPIPLFSLGAGFLMILGVMRHWSQDEREREHNVPPRAKVIKRTDTLTAEVAVAAAMVFLLSPLGFSRLDADSGLFEHARGSAIATALLSASRYVGFTWFEAPHSVPIVHAWAGTYAEHNPFAQRGTRAIKAGIFGLRFIYEILVVTAFVDLLRITKRVATKEDLRQFETIHRDGAVEAQLRAVADLKELVMAGRSDAADLLEQFAQPAQSKLVRANEDFEIRLNAIDCLLEASDYFGWRSQYFATRDAVEQIIVSALGYESGLASTPEGDLPFGTRRTTSRPVASVLGRAHCDLGDILVALAYGEPNDIAKSRLKEAVQAYDQAHKFFTSADMPVEAAKAQEHLAGALHVMGDVETGPGKLASYQLAVSGLKGALDAYKVAQPKEGSGPTEIKLGDALAALADCPPGGGEEGAADPKPAAGGVEHLLEAKAAYVRAIKQFEAAGAMLDWAAAQTKLGVVLHKIARRESGGGSRSDLRDAITAFLAALAVYRRSSPDWPATKMQLGDVMLSLARLGGEDLGDDWFGQANATYRDALKAFDAKEQPHEWAALQDRIGDAAAGKAGARGAVQVAALLREAVEAYESAAAVFWNFRPALWVRTQGKLVAALRALAPLEPGASGQARLQRAEALDRQYASFAAVVVDYDQMANPPRLAPSTPPG